MAKKWKIVFWGVLVIAWVLSKIGQLPFVLIHISISLWHNYLTFRITYLVKAFGKLCVQPESLKTHHFFKYSHLLSRKIVLCVLFILLFLTIYSYSIVRMIHALPSPAKLTDLSGPLTTTIYDREGNVLYKLYDEKNRTLVKLDDLPKDLIHATVAIEDKNFFRHPGIDIFAVARALFSNIKYHQLQGGSTITQQLIKNTLLSPERTITRKTKEMILAYWTERIFTKDEILQMYFNHAPYGGTAWGIESASETYFSKNATDLTLAESAFLAGLPASPTNYSPYGTYPELAKLRQKEVLRRMTEDGYITNGQADQAFAAPLKLNHPNQTIKAPHFVMYIKELLEEKYGKLVVSQGGLAVYTSLDLSIQEMAEKVVREEVNKLTPLKVSNGAAMITDGKNGQILAMVGSKDYFNSPDGNYNVALALRQPGSAIKPITYATAFTLGYSPGTTLLDTPTVFSNQWETYAPLNYDGQFHGRISIRTALGSSYNVPAVKILSLIGIGNMINMAKDLGITTFDDKKRFGLSLTLGGGEVKMIEMMSVYGTFSQLGIKHELTPILEVIDSQGNILEDNKDGRGERVLSQAIAYMITSILTDNQARTPAFGSNSLLVIPGHTVAVKTGTTDSKRDNWTFGYNPNYVVGVWVGNNDNSAMDPLLTSGVTGATPIWHKIFANLLAQTPDVSFQKPPEVVQSIVDGHSDLVINGKNAATVVSATNPRSSEASRKRDKFFVNKDGKKRKYKDTITYTDPLSAGENKNSF